MRFSLTLAIMLAASVLKAQAPHATKDDDAVRSLVAAYADAREQRDAKRLSLLLAPDADQLVSSGEWRKGRDELLRGMQASSERNSGTRTIKVDSVRFIAPNVAVADARYEIAGAQDGQSRRMWSTFVVSRNGGVWRIEAIRNMLPAATR